MALAHLARIGLARFFGFEIPTFLMFYPAVMLVAMILGFWAGLATTVLAAFVASYFYLLPVHRLAVERHRDLALTLIFVTMGVLISAIAESERRRRQDVKDASSKELQSERALKAAQRQLSNIANKEALRFACAGIPDATLLTDAEGVIADFNRAYASLHVFHTPTEPHEFSKIFDLFDAAGHWCELDQWPVCRALRGESGVGCEYTARRKDTGETLVASYSFGPLRDARGQITGTVTIIRDTCRAKADEEALGLRERLRLTLESGDLVEWEMDLKTSKIFRSIGYDRLFGYETMREDFTLGTLLEFVLPESRNATGEAFDQAMKTGHGTAEIPIRTLGGESRWIWLAARVYRNGEGRPARLIGVAKDITERKRAEKVSRWQAREQRFAQHAGGVGTFSLDLQTGARIDSPEMFEIYQIPPGNPFPDSAGLLQLTHPDDRATCEANIKAMYIGQSINYEHRIVLPTGEMRWMQIAGGVERDEAGKPERFIGTTQDITHRKQIEATLQLQGEQLRIAQRTAGIGVYTLNLPSMKWVNSAEMFQIFGVPLDQPFPTPEALEQMTHPDDRTFVTQQHAAAFAGQSVCFERRIIRPDGEVRWIESSATVELDKAGTPSRIVGVCQDVTQRKQLAIVRQREEEEMRLAQQTARISTFSFELPNGVLRYGREYSIFGKQKTMHIEDFIDRFGFAEDRRKMRAGMAAVARGESATVQWRGVSDDGGVQWIETRMGPDRDASGQIVGVVGNSRDISESKHNESERLENLELLRLAHRAAGLGTFVVNIPSGDRICSPETLELLGIPDHSPRVTRAEIRSLSHSDDWSTVDGQHTKMLAGQSINYTRRVLLSDGTERWVETIGTPEFDGSGKVIRYVGVCRDVTANKKFEDLLRSNAERLQMTQEAAGLGSYEWNPTSDAFSATPKAYALFGLPPDTSWPGLDGLLEMTHPDDRELCRVQHQSILDGKPFQFERRIVLPDGTLRWIESIGSAGQDAAGQAVYRGIVKDVTERKKAEELLRETDERFRMAERAAGIGTFVVELPSREMKCSDYVYSILGIADQSTKIDYELFETLIYPEDRELFREQYAQMLSGQPARVESRIVRPDGRVCWVEMVGKPSVDIHGKPDRFSGVCWDVTERREMESRYRQVQKMEAVGQIAGGVAHDFNNLLGVIIGNMELLSERVASDEISHKYFERIRMAVHSATDVTRQLLAFSRKQVVQPVILNINTCVEQLNKMTQRIIGEHIQVSLLLEPRLSSVKIDPGQVNQILMNLVVNSRDAMPQGGKLIIQTCNVHLDQDFVEAHAGSKTGDFVKLAVSDTGCGMSPDILKKIFEPFFTTKEPGKGTGLGLATVYGIVKQADGHLSVTSQPGLGTTFDLYLPVVVSHSPARLKKTSPEFGWGSETILLVEDEPALRDVTCARLCQLGYKVIEAACPSEAIRAFTANARDIDLLLTDVVMPEMNGRMLADQLREKCPDLPVLYMSGYTDDEILRQGVQEAAAMIVSKPFTIEALSSRIRDVLARERR